MWHALHTEYMCESGNSVDVNGKEDEKELGARIGITLGLTQWGLVGWL